MATCPSCRTDNPGGFRFCGACGTALPTEVRSERRERRVISVLFADVVGFTSRSERADVEDVDAFLAPYVQLLRREIERHGGAVCKLMGDGVMAVFGAPVTHEDDPERAVRAGLAICRDVQSETGLQVRVGITSGEALVTVRDGGDVDALGDVVNTASRLESAAPPGGVLVDARTHRATAQAVRYHEADSVTAKGKSEPVPCWRAEEPRSIVPEQLRSDAVTLRGRDFELGLLRGLLDRSAAEPSTQLVSIIGAPGIGKSRLVAELGAYIEEKPDLTTWRIGRSLSYGEGVALWALGEIIKSQAGILESDGVDVARDKLASAVEALIASTTDAAWVTARLEPLVGLAGAGPDAMAAEDGRVEAFAAWRRFFEALAEDGPAVVVFEDTHWADDALLDFIDTLADRAGALPLLIVCTARPELLERRPAWGGGKPNALTISLSPLTSEDTARLIAELLDRAVLPVVVQQGLLARAEGNPLYAQEYVRMLQDRGLLTTDAGEWALDASADALPESLHGIIAARLDTLSPQERALIQDAAVVGRTAWLGAVCAITQRTPAAADELLYVLERKQLLQRMRRSTIDGETEFTFGHALSRDVAYAQIPRAERAAKHEAAAAWIERLAAGREDKAELLADHYGRTIAIREQLGEDIAGLAPRARAAFTEAGRQAASTHAHPAAARHYRAALRLTPPDAHAERAALLLSEAIACAAADTASLELLETARDAQLDVDAWEAAARVELLLYGWHRDRSGGVERYRHLARASDLVTRVPPCELTFQIEDAKAHRLFTSSDFEGVVALSSERIPEAAQAGIHVGADIMHMWRGNSRVQLGDPGGIAEMRSAAEVLARRSHSRTSGAWANLGEAMLGLGDVAGAYAATSEGVSWALRLGSKASGDQFTANLAHMAYHRGEWRQAERLAASVRSAARRIELDAARILERIALARRETGTWRAVADELVADAMETEDDESLYMGLALQAIGFRATGALERASDTADRFLARWRAAGGLFNASGELAEVSVALAELERHSDIRDAAESLPEASAWKRPLLALADARYADAAAGFEAMQALTMATESHLLAAAAGTPGPHADAVRAFADARGAPLYRDLLGRPAGRATGAASG